jgi:hypothetical protein
MHRRRTAIGPLWRKPAKLKQDEGCSLLSFN